MASGLNDTREVPPAWVTRRPKLAALAMTFPTIRNAERVVRYLDPFWPERLATESKVLSHGGQLAVRFVLMVYNRDARFRGVKPFDLAEAMMCWDDPHCAAFATWARSPWFA